MIQKPKKQDNHHWYLDLQRAKGIGSDVIAEVQQRIKEESDAEELRSLHLLLAAEYAYHGRLADAEIVLRKLSEQAPDDPYPLISLAEKKLYYGNNHESTLPIIDQAIEVAFRSGDFRRYALGVKARIALKLRAFDIIEDVLQLLLKLTFEPGNHDCAIERDFFDRLPAGAIDKTLARQFDEFARAKG
jgi:hypothetical protein